MSAPSPCPFCGSEPRVWSGEKGRELVACNSHGCPSSPVVGGATRDEAIAKWNTRTPIASAVRKPVGVTYIPAPHEELVVVCDDGSVWSRLYVGGEGWVEFTGTIPGTLAATDALAGDASSPVLDRRES